MATGTTPLFESYPSGFPSVVAAGRALNLRLFIPPIDDDIHFKERVRAKCLPVSPRCPACNQSKTRPQLYNTKQTAAWEDWVGQQAQNQLRHIHLEGGDFLLPIKDSRIIISVRFTRRKPSSYPKSMIHHVRKPDIDNLMKGLLDGLVKGNVIADDSAVTDEHVQKRYPEPGHPVGVEVDLTAIAV